MVDQNPKQKAMVLNWLNEGAIWKDGVLLFKLIFKPDHPFLTLIRKGGSQLKYEILKQALTLYAERIPTVEARTERSRPKMREEYQFLSEPDCPVELKILASNKITAYHNYVSGHRLLFDCSTNAEQYAAAKKTVENFIENRRIMLEFEFYKENNKILGKHPIFKVLKRFQELRKLSIIDLIKRQRNLENNLWRIRSEIKKGNRKDLEVEREKALAEKAMELAEVNRILEDRNSLSYQT